MPRELCPLPIREFLPLTRRFEDRFVFLIDNGVREILNRDPMTCLLIISKHTRLSDALFTLQITWGLLLKTYTLKNRQHYGVDGGKYARNC